VEFEFLTLIQTAKMARISYATLWRLIKSGKGPRVTKISDRRRVVSIKDFHDWTASRAA
jgi:predicted DNA-binding transcriptional regulator AlpA